MVIDRINSLESVLQKRADVECVIDRGTMEETYYNLLNPSHGTGGPDVPGDTLALVEDCGVDVSELVDSLGTILSFGEIEQERAERFEDLVAQFEALEDKESSTDEARSLRRNLMKDYYPIYEKVFLKDYQSAEEAPAEVELFPALRFLE